MNIERGRGEGNRMNEEGNDGGIGERKGRGEKRRKEEWEGRRRGEYSIRYNV